MRFEVLGPLRAYVGDSEVVVSAGRGRTLLAVLLLHADRTVPLAQLVDALWPDAPPTSARNQVQVCVSQLRKRLSQAGLPEEVIATDPTAGYRLRVDPEQIDVYEFRALVEQARAAVAAGRLAVARDRYRAALDLWRGPALAEIKSAQVSRAAAALDEEHIQAVEERVEVEVALGGAGELVGELSDLVRRYQYRERLHAALMRALYRAGRMGDALAAYRRARQMLHDELGTEPGAELQRLHQAILNRDVELGVPSEQPAGAAAAAVPAVQVPVPQELPAEASCFVGRDEEIGQVREALGPAAGGSRRRPAVVVLYGPGGVGKSALAVRVAHDLADAFPAGQLYVDLCGSTPGMRPVPALEVLSRFLRSLGVHPSEIPSDEAGAAALFRSVTADQRLLLLLDNAAGKGQVLPLLPGNPGCAVLVTSRYPQPSLDVDHRLRVDVLGEGDGLALLTRLTDGEVDSAAARTILTLTGGLPLAIRIAGGRLAGRPHLGAAEFAARLADSSGRLDELQLDDLAVRASVGTSYDALRSSDDPAERFAARAFRMLGLLHVPDIGPGAVAAMLAERDVRATRAALDRLVDAQLLEAAGNRYRLHDLVRLVAAEQATDGESPTVRAAAIDRAMAFYTDATWRADARIRLATVLPFDPPAAHHDVPAPTFARASEARAWIEDELDCLLEVLAQAATSARVDGRALVRLGYPLWSILDMRCAWQSAHAISRLMLDVADGRDDKELTACAHMLHGRSEASFGNYEAAVVHLEQAYARFVDLGNEPGTALALNGLGLVSSRQRNENAALAYYAKALEVTDRLKLTQLRSSVLNNMSASYACLGQMDRAVRAAEEGVAGCSEEDLIVRATGLLNLAGALCLRGSYADAVRRADDAIRVARETGDRQRVSETLVVRSEINLRRQRPDDAYADAATARPYAEASRYRFVVAAALWQQSKALAMLGRAREAAKLRSQATAALQQLGGTYVDPLLARLIEIADPQPSHASNPAAVAPVALAVASQQSGLTSEIPPR